MYAAQCFSLAVQLCQQERQQERQQQRSSSSSSSSSSSCSSLLALPLVLCARALFTLNMHESKQRSSSSSSSSTNLFAGTNEGGMHKHPTNALSVAAVKHSIDVDVLRAASLFHEAVKKKRMLKTTIFPKRECSLTSPPTPEHIHI